MKRVLTFALILISALAVLSSCEKAPFVTMTSPSSYNFTREGGTQTIVFSCNRDWSLSSSESWILISSTTGKAADGDIALTITCSPNTTYDSRTATITLKVEELTETITVTQDTGLGLNISPMTFDLDNAAQDIEIEVENNVQYAVEIDEAGAEWIIYGGTKALTTDKVTFSVAANITYDPREANITFKQIDGPLVAIVNIKQASGEGLIVEKTSYEIDRMGGTLEVEVQANVEYEVSTEDTWIHYVQTKALSSSAIVLTIDENETFYAREGKIHVAQKNGLLNQTITIKQNGRIAVTSIELNTDKFNTDNLILEEGMYKTLTPTVKPDNATDMTIVWTSSNESVATVNSNGKVHAISKGSATIKATAYDGSGVNASCAVTVYRIDTPVAVDLGLPSGVKWASFNIGASSPEENGLYYAWGETEPKSCYSWETYTYEYIYYYYIDHYDFTKYNKIDNKTVLDLDDDVAHMKLGGKWRMPTAAEWTELQTKCEWMWINTGYLVISKNNLNSIYLPAAGIRSNMEYLQAGSDGGYWSSSLYSDDTYCIEAWFLFFNSEEVYRAYYDYYRCDGLSVRPVSD